MTNLNALFALLILTMLSGCVNLTQTYKSAQNFILGSQQAIVVNNKARVKTQSFKQKTSNVKSALPSKPATGFPENTNTLPTAPSPALAQPLDREQLPPSKILNIGSTGEAVLALEQRLTELRFDVGLVDGFYDKQTWQGVMAFQKYAGLKRTGTVTPETQDNLSNAMLPGGGHPELGLPRIEINLARQLLLFFDEQGLNRVISVSTGSNRKYCETSKKSGERVCGIARTPRGMFHIQHRIPGWRESDLGKLYNPLYFHGGFAIHGSPSVPATNVSHGCVRLSVNTAIWFYHAVKNGMPVIVY